MPRPLLGALAALGVSAIGVSLSAAFCGSAAVLAQNSQNEPASNAGAAVQPRGPPSPLDILDVNAVAHLEEAVPVTLRDGTHLIATLVIPNGASGSSPRPTILDQSPYPALMEFGAGGALFARLVREGYVIVVVNDRGTQWSEGEYHWLRGAAADGADVIQWIIKQPWSNGSVGAWGCSSSGEVQFPLAKANPPGLKATVAMGAATGVGAIPGFADQGIFYTGGVPLFTWALWYRSDGYLHHPKLPPNLPPEERVALIHAFNPATSAGTSPDLSWVGHLPSEDLLRAIGSPDTEWNAMIKMAPDDPAWKSYDFINAGDRTSVPMLHVDSWYDTIEVYGTTKAFEYLSSNSPNQYMIIGPGAHCSMLGEVSSTTVGARPVGNAKFDYVGQEVAWFDHWLRDDGHGKFDMPRVQYYPLESGRWVSAASWPPHTAPRRLYLASAGHANGLNGDGQLSGNVQNGVADRFLDDPLHPVPSNGGGCCTADAAVDQTEIEKRADVLVYTSDPLTLALDVAGYAKATLYFSTSVPDTDITLKLVDVYPDGKAYNVLDTIQRLRYRDGVEKKSPMSKDKIYKVVLREMVLASRFAPGHRIRIEIAGTNFPEYERNMNTGGRNYDESKAVVAQSVIYHDYLHRSYLELPSVQ